MSEGGDMPAQHGGDEARFEQELQDWWRRAEAHFAAMDKGADAVQELAAIETIHGHVEAIGEEFARLRAEAGAGDRIEGGAP